MRNQKGQVLVETAIILPLLLFLIFGLIDFARVMYTKNSLTNAARSGARTAAVTPDLLNDESGALDSGTSTANTIKLNLLNGIPDSVTYKLDRLKADGTTPVTGKAMAGDLVKVTVTWTDFPMITPFYKLAEIITNATPEGSDVLTLTGQAAMRYE